MWREIVSVDQLVPEDHLLRKIDAAIDFSCIYDLVEDRYCHDNGLCLRPEKIIEDNNFC